MGKPLRTLKVKDNTYEKIIKVQAMMTLQEGKKHSIDDVVSYLLNCLPDAKITIEGINQG